MSQRPSRSTGRLIRALRRTFMRFHVALYRFSDGLLGGRAPGRSFLLLTTIGRKSGRERVTPILYIPEGHDFILVASNWGEPFLPAWLLNLQAQPQARVHVGRRHLAVVAHQADPEERASLWLSIVARYGEFARYQRGLVREIPLIILRPTPLA